VIDEQGVAVIVKLVAVLVGESAIYGNGNEISDDESSDVSSQFNMDKTCDGVIWPRSGL